MLILFFPRLSSRGWHEDFVYGRLEGTRGFGALYAKLVHCFSGFSVRTHVLLFPFIRLVGHLPSVIVLIDELTHVVQELMEPSRYYVCSDVLSWLQRSSAALREL